jgi:PIN domain
MTKKLETRTVFMDTQAFMKQGLNFKNATLSKINSLGKTDCVNILITDIVKKEVQSKILDNTEKTIKAKNDLIVGLKKEDCVDLVPLITNIESTTDENLKQISINRWEQYIEDTKIEIISCKAVCTEEIVDAYFIGTFPFSAGKKKNEFPDAISLTALKNWANQKNKTVYVISEDKDLKGFCDQHNNLIHLEKITEFLDIYNNEEEKLTTVLHELIQKKIDEISSIIHDDFKNREFIYDQNYEADVYNIDITDLKILNIDVIEMKDHVGLVNFSTQISFVASISGPDYDNAMWDSEDKKLYCFSDFDADLNFDEIYDITLEIAFGETEDDIEVLNILHDDNTTILYYDDGFPYK